MKIAVSVESSVDINEEIAKKYDISIIPFHVMLGEDDRVDGDVTPQEIFDYVTKTKLLPKTAALNEEEYKEYFEGLLKNYDAVIHLPISAGISSTYTHAQAAADALKNVYIVDSKSLSTGIALLAIYARKLAESGLDAKTVAEKTALRADHVQASFVIEKLNYLYKGGRCSALAMFGANVLKIRPQIILKDGKMTVHKKYMGKMEKVVANYCRDTIAEFNTPDLSVGFVTYSSATPEMIESARNTLKEAGFKEIYETHAGATVSSHCGENTIGILYINNAEE